MPQRQDDVAAQIQNANCKKIYVTQQASGVASASLQLSNVAVPGKPGFLLGGISTTPGRLIVLQGSADFRYNFSNGAGTATANDVLVKAGAPGEFVYVENIDTHINVIQDSAGGIVRIYAAV